MGASGLTVWINPCSCIFQAVLCCMHLPHYLVTQDPRAKYLFCSLLEQSRLWWIYGWSLARLENIAYRGLRVFPIISVTFDRWIHLVLPPHSTFDIALRIERWTHPVLPPHPLDRRIHSVLPSHPQGLHSAKSAQAHLASTIWSVPLIAQRAWTNVKTVLSTLT